MYDLTKFGFPQFEQLRKQTLAAETPDKIVELRNKLKEQLNSRDGGEMKIKRVNEIEKFLFLSQDKTDLDLTLDVFNLYMKRALIDEDLNFGEKFVKMCFLLDAREKIHQLVDTNNSKASLISLLFFLFLFVLFFSFLNYKQTKKG